jgi:putative addiction module CopG family antidote
MSITLPNELAAAVRDKVASGEYASESEVIRDGLRVLIARERVVERWLRNKVGPAYDALEADPSRAVTADRIRARLAAEHRKATGKNESTVRSRSGLTCLSAQWAPAAAHHREIGRTA